MTYRCSNATFFGEEAVVLSGKDIDRLVDVLAGGWEYVEGYGFLGADAERDVYAFDPSFLDIEGADEEEVVSTFEPDVPEDWHPLQCTFGSKITRRIPVVVNGVECEALIARPGAALLLFYRGGLTYGIVR